MNLHYDRLVKWLKVIKYEVIPSKHEVTKSIDTLLRKNQIEDGVLKIIITGGVNPEDTSISRVIPTIVLMTHQLHTIGEYIDVCTVPENRGFLKFIKMMNRIPNLIARRKALAQGANEAIYKSDEHLIEASCYNLFLIKGDQIITPKLEGRGLEGITRTLLLKNADVQFGEIPETTSGPLFLSNMKGIVPVRNLDNRELQQDPDLIGQLRGLLDQLEKKEIASVLVT